MKKTIKFFLIISAAIFGIWAGGLVAFYFQIPTTPTQNSEHTDAIIVLTGGKERVPEGLELFAEGYADKILISGVGKDSTEQEVIGSLALPDALMGKINLEQIDFGYEATNTPENALEAKAWVEENKIKSVRLITANYHMQRAVKLFKAVMPSLRIIENPVFPDDFKKSEWPKNRNTARLIFWEYNKYLASL
jgi:uncharacterized SAM-binding protein YcdF (DUF218 family)